ncbi:DUF732 domain-containing protein [Amycolatopsis sp. NPDC051758]|uniref:DUF732 domain-containing protein n=1 Tax=Amycolatopsis sp. NPDC051758 TaxID=3363935 RepID=UPI0037B91C5F
MTARRPLRSLLAVTAAAVAVGLAVTGIVLASCATSPTHPDPDISTADVLYLNEIRHAAVELNTPAASFNVIAAGRDTCASLGTGTTVSAAVKTVLQRFYPDLASVVVVAAIHNYCPQHTTQLSVPTR